MTLHIIQLNDNLTTIFEECVNYIAPTDSVVLIIDKHQLENKTQAKTFTTLKTSIKDISSAMYCLDANTSDQTEDINDWISSAKLVELCLENPGIKNWY